MPVFKSSIKKEELLFSNGALVKLIIPLIIEQLLSILVGMADSIMVASVGEAAVSSVSLIDSINILLFYVFSSVATGGAVVAGQYLGSKRPDEACKTCDQLLNLIIVFSLIVTLIVYVGKGFILNVLFGQIEPDVKAYANTYLLIVFAAIPFMAVYNCGAAMFRAMGNTKVSMKTSMLMNAINVCGNALLIYGFHRGVEGVAIPTLVSRMVAAFVIIGLLKKETLEVHLSKKFSPKLDGSRIKRILTIGIPNGVENSLFQLGKVMLLSLVSTMGTSAVAANAVGNTMSTFQIMPGLAMGYAVVTVISHCVGAGRYDQARHYTKKMILMTYIMQSITNIAILLAMPLILRAYGLTAETSALAEQILKFHAVFAMVLWPMAFTLPNTLRAANDAKFTMIVSVSSMWIFRIGFGVLLGKVMGIGVMGIWIAMIIDWVARAICFIIRYRSGKWTQSKLI
ncbi:MAG: MATE family efflux transporter [Clostridiales bacterium]|nr:MATE family efflux transporter [Clostridiales bacterium]